MNKEWEEAYSKMQARVEEAVKAAGDEPVVVYSAYEHDDKDIPIDNLNEVAFEGEFTVVAEYDSFWDNHRDGRGHAYVSKNKLTNPTWLDLAVEANKAINTTHDFHHAFLEGATVRKIAVDKTKLELYFGS